MWLQRFHNWPRIQFGNVSSCVPFFYSFAHLPDFTALVCKFEAAQSLLYTSVCLAEICPSKDAFTLFIRSLWVFMQMISSGFHLVSLQMQLFASLPANTITQKWVTLFLRGDWLAEAVWWCHRALSICNKTPFSLAFIGFKKLSRKTLGRFIVYRETDDGVDAQLKLLERRPSSTGFALLLLRFLVFPTHLESCKSAWTPSKTVSFFFFQRPLMHQGPFHLPCPLAAEESSRGGILKTLGFCSRVTGSRFTRRRRGGREKKYRQLNHNSLS